jgi:hypothetical protein
LGGFFQLINGLTLVALGISIAVGHRYPKWIGFVGAVAGLGFVAGGTATSHTGFSPMSGWFLTPATLLLAIFLVGVVILMLAAKQVNRNPHLKAESPLSQSNHYLRLALRWG